MTGITPNKGDQRRRLEDAYRRLGTRSPVCSYPNCDETNPHALTGAAPSIVCYEHQAANPVEAHHQAAKANDDFTVDVPANDHRVINDRQRDWPVNTLRNPTGSPLIRSAAKIRGWLDVLQLVHERTVDGVPETLEDLDRVLTDLLGPNWWIEADWEVRP